MSSTTSTDPRILILESDQRTGAAVRRYIVKEWRGASVQSVGVSLDGIVGNSERLKTFDAIIAGCDFSTDGTADSPTLRALRAISADPENPPVLLLTQGGSEYTAVQSIKAGAYDYLVRSLLGREQLVSAVRRALQSRNPSLYGEVDDAALEIFGYDIRRRLSSHGNVSVHVAYSAERRHEVVLKVLHRGRGSLSLDAGFERFVDEFKLLHDIDDPAVARIYDFRVTSRCVYIAMEYFPDGHLGRHIASGLDPETALALTAEIAQALAIIHAAGVVHRDLKPGNIMLRKNGTVALIDFGISRARRGDEPMPLDDGPIAGTPYYISPEQACGDPTDERTDLYALGIILYQMLAGTKPYVGDNTENILAQHRHAPIPALPPPLARYQPLIDRLLAKTPSQRLASARELIELIERVRQPTVAGDYELSATSA